MNKTKTNRGFSIIEGGRDTNGVKFNIQKSSSAMEDKIWFGAIEIGLKHFKAGEGWKDVELTDTMQEHYVANNRLHLNREQVAEIIPILQKFVDTGEL